MLYNTYTKKEGLKIKRIKNINNKYTLYKEFLIISMFISSKSCSDMQSTKNGAKKNKNSIKTPMTLDSAQKKILRAFTLYKYG